ncbi:gamma-glutamyl-gamma-aminobutyrate hydrolase family protein [Acetilactobacillus jinshanensis]|uniref:Gamma-glutamyl-gamma-aminobutyrate hydrolase family protein n=1 Tax=Acetilactobacillus jinshanensis TaxID=1720083 RepID=A0A4V1ALL7_9LACO|nr:gamma-glutamyl-gamma-aminobutyrate hydrolase family protein [Acetilactobacillus jinshanensis]QBP18039.1 gamma-glutamyl-gamma-aminobutyrate hydrolase family protein [Acetilactobacillus jinshanensis]URL60902.1 gamma-glutamyl-gamma-aminobutyrate hydrolase family protein [uncultured bacterium]
MKIGVTMYETSFPTSKTNIRIPHYGAYPLTDALIYNHVTPLLLPSVINPSQRLIKQMVSQFNGLILGGGDDIDPGTYGEPAIMPELTYPERDQFELAIIHETIHERKPILGVCRGSQMINVALGGKLYQNIYTQITDRQLIDHEGSFHSVTISPKSRLYRVLGPKQIVNSRHHQAIKTLGHNLKVVARASDQIIEGIENHDASIQGVQWHPENLWQSKLAQNNLFKDFFKRVKTRMQ